MEVLTGYPETLNIVTRNISLLGIQKPTKSNQGLTKLHLLHYKEK